MASLRAVPLSSIFPQTHYMDIAQAIPTVLELLGDTGPMTVTAVLETIDKQIKWQHHLIDADAARTNPLAPWLDALVANQPQPHPGLTMVAATMLSATMSTFLRNRSNGFHKLPPAERMLRCKRNLADMRLKVNIAVAKLGVPGCTWLTSGPGAPAEPPGKNPCPPLSSPLAPVVEARAGTDPPPPPTFSAPVPQSGPAAVQTGRCRRLAKVTALPLDVLAQVLERIDSLAAIDSFVSALPKAAKARSSVQALALTDGTSAAPWALCTDFVKLRVLTINAPMLFDSIFPPPLSLDKVTLDQSDSAGWEGPNTLHAVAALGLATVRTVVVEDADVAALEVLANDVSIALLRCILGGAGVDVTFTTVSGMTRIFTRLALAAMSMPVIYCPSTTPHLTHLALSDWLPREWIRVLFESAPVSLESLEVALTATPPDDGPDADLQRLLDYRGSGWVGCDRLNTITLSCASASAAAPVEIDKADIRAFMSAALSRLVAIETRNVFFFSF